MQTKKSKKSCDILELTFKIVRVRYTIYKYLMKAEALRGVMSTFFRYSLKAAAGKTSGSSAQNLEESGALCGCDSRVLAHAL